MLLNLLYFIGSYIVLFILYTLVLNRKRKTYKDANKQMDIEYLVNKFQLDRRVIKYNTLKWITNIVNPLIMAITFVVVINIESITLGIIVGFAIMLALIYAFYEIIGRYLKGRNDKNV